MAKADDELVLPPGLAEALPEKERDSLFQTFVTKLRVSMENNDAKGVQMASVGITTLRRFVGDKDALKIKFDPKFIESIAHMAKHQFSIPSRLKSLLADEKKPAGIA